MKFNKDVLIIPSKKGCSKIKIIPIENRKENLIISFRKNDNGYSKIEKFKTDFMGYITNKRYETTDIKNDSTITGTVYKMEKSVTVRVYYSGTVVIEGNISNLYKEILQLISKYLRYSTITLEC